MNVSVQCNMNVSVQCNMNVSVQYGCYCLMSMGKEATRSIYLLLMFYCFKLDLLSNH